MYQSDTFPSILALEDTTEKAPFLTIPCSTNEGDVQISASVDGLEHRQIYMEEFTMVPNHADLQ